MAGAHKSHLWAFRLLLAAHDRGDQIRAEDESKKWEAKKSTYLKKMKAGDEAYRPDPKLNPLVSFLFPEIADGLSQYPKKKETAVSVEVGAT